MVMSNVFSTNLFFPVSPRICYVIQVMNSWWHCVLQFDASMTRKNTLKRLSLVILIPNWKAFFINRIGIYMDSYLALSTIGSAQFDQKDRNWWGCSYQSDCYKGRKGPERDQRPLLQKEQCASWSSCCWGHLRGLQGLTSYSVGEGRLKSLLAICKFLISVVDLSWTLVDFSHYYLDPGLSFYCGVAIFVFVFGLIWF